jgi:hypothetical protein
MISPAPAYPSRKEHDDATSFAAISPWAASVARNKLQAWNPRTQQSEPLSSPSSSSAHESRPSAPSSESVKSAVSQALSRSLLPSGDPSCSNISALSLSLSAIGSGSLSSFSPNVNGASRPHHKISSLASAVGANLPIRTLSVRTSGSLSAALTSASPPASSAAPTQTARLDNGNSATYCDVCFQVLHTFRHRKWFGLLPRTFSGSLLSLFLMQSSTSRSSPPCEHFNSSCRVLQRDDYPVYDSYDKSKGVEHARSQRRGRV